MKQANHTPGPWTVVDKQLSTVEIRCAKGIYIAEVANLSTEDFANTALIASAPELLHWATEYTSNVTPGESATDYALRMDAAFNGLRAAIAKAGGAA